MAATTSSSIRMLQSADEEVEKVYAVVIKHQSPSVNMDHTVLTTVTEHQNVVRRWIDGVYADGNTNVPRHVGFQFECCLLTVVLCVGNQCQVYQLPEERGSFPLSLIEFLCDHNRFIFVGTKIQESMSFFKTVFAIGGSIEVKELGPEPTIKKENLLLASVELREGDKFKCHPTTNLSLPQVHYASLNAFLNLQIPA